MKKLNEKELHATYQRLEKEGNSDLNYVKTQAKVRPCMQCKTEIFSLNYGHRFCVACKNSVERLAMAEFLERIVS